MRTALLLLILTLALGCTSPPGEVKNASVLPSAEVAEVGDYVAGEYTLHDGVNLTAHFEAVLGSGELLPGIEEALLGMRAGEARVVTLPPEKAFGRINRSLLRWEPRSFSLRKRVNLSAQEFREAFGMQPEKGASFESGWLRIHVLDVGGGGVLIEREPIYSTVNTTGGRISITANATHINYFFTPELNVTVVDASGGFVTYRAANATHVLVDRNHPLAGKRLTAEVRLERLIKKRELVKMRISWQEDISAAIREAVAEDKPVLLYFYSQRCDTCNAMEEAFEDARIRVHAGELIFVKLDLEKESRFAALHGISTAPALLLLNSTGKELAKIEGELSAQELDEMLREVGVIR